jgi:hypothetical protein
MQAMNGHFSNQPIEKSMQENKASSLYDIAVTRLARTL